MGWASRTRATAADKPSSISGYTTKEAIRGGSTARGPSGKISTALERLIEPFRDDSMSLEQYRTLVALGATSWNLATVPPGERRSVLSEASDPKGGPESELIRQMVMRLVRQKDDLFPDDNRFILSWDVEPRAKGFSLMVVAARAEPAD